MEQTAKMTNDSMAETPVQQRVRIRASEMGLLVFRNNSGACYDDTGRLIRYGLGNDSEQVNRRIKSGDLVGLAPTLITAAHIGQVFGRFINLECKREGWHMVPSDARAGAQLAFHRLVMQYGGLAGFVTGPQDIERVLRGEPL